MGLLDPPAYSRTAADATFYPLAGSLKSVPVSGITAANTDKWRPKLAAVRAGTARAKVLCIGDSTSYGSGSTNGQINSWVSLVRQALDTNYAPATNGLVIPKYQNGAGQSSSYLIAGSGWLTALQGWAGRSSYSSGAATSGSLNYAPGFRCDRVDIYYINHSNPSFNAVVNVNLNGSSIGTFDTAVGSGSNFAKVTMSFTATDNPTIGLTRLGTGGSTWIVGMEAYLSTSPAIGVGNAGIEGTATLQWQDDASTTSSLKALRLYAPDLSVIMLGVNDSTGTSKVDYKSRLTNIVKAAKESGDVMLMSPVPTNDATRAANEALYRDAAQEIATRYGCIFLDLFARWGTWAAANAKGYMFDDTHPNDAGYQDIKTAVYTALTNV